MKHSFTRWGSALLASLAIAGCGGGSSDTVAPVAASLSATIAAASAVAANDTASNTAAAFTVLQSAGVPAVTIAGAPKVNFSVFSDG
ncbi:MAG: cytochrome C, partial [Rhodoferax sp.]|nr:cytochrome C [Rhodoferax sp.]